MELIEGSKPKLRRFVDNVLGTIVIWSEWEFVVLIVTP